MRSLVPGRLLLACGLLSTVCPPAGAAEPDRFLPADAELVAVVNVRQLLDSPLLKKYALAHLQAGLNRTHEAQKLLDAAGIDPWKDLDSLTFTSAGGPAKGKMFLVARGRFRPEKIQAAVEAEAKTDPSWKVEKVDGLALFQAKAKDKPLFAAFADKGTLVLSSERDLTLGTARKAPAESARIDPKLKAAVGRVSGTDSVWVAAVATEDLKKILSAQPQTKAFAAKLDSVTATVQLTDAAQTNLRIQTSDPQAAKQVRLLINTVVKPALLAFAGANEQFGPALTDLVTATKVALDMDAVTVSLKVTEEMIEKAGKKEP